MRKFILSCLVFVSLMLDPSLGYAVENTYEIEAAGSYIDCSARYIVLGKYEAKFSKFSGTLYFDPDNPGTSSIVIKIDTASVRSKHPALDRFARSKRLLNSAKYPQAVFKSTIIEKMDGDGYRATGMLSLHGVAKEISFPFNLKGPYHSDKKIWLVANGKWTIRRKDFNVMWNKVLDHGGIIVSDHVSVDWEITAEYKH